MCWFPNEATFVEGDLPPSYTEVAIQPSESSLYEVHIPENLLHSRICRRALDHAMNQAHIQYLVCINPTREVNVLMKELEVVLEGQDSWLLL